MKQAGNGISWRPVELQKAQSTFFLKILRMSQCRKSTNNTILSKAVELERLGENSTFENFELNFVVLGFFGQKWSWAHTQERANTTGTSKCAAISKAQKVQSF